MEAATPRTAARGTPTPRRTQLRGREAGLSPQQPGRQVGDATRPRHGSSNGHQEGQRLPKGMPNQSAAEPGFGLALSRVPGWLGQVRAGRGGLAHTAHGRATPAPWPRLSAS